MKGSFCPCFLQFISNPGSSISTKLEFGFILFIIGIGITINLKFRTKLLDEKKKMPIGRRGNVVEPVMRVFCLLQMVFWPYDLILLWAITNEVVPTDSINPKLCSAIMITLKSGRMCIAYHSLFVALIRYMHIVQDQILNQWNYERVANYFKVFCIIFPLAMECIGAMTTPPYYTMTKEIEDCIGFEDDLNDGFTIEKQVPSELVQWTMNYLPISLIQAVSLMYTIATVSVLANVTEAYLYLRIFQKMKRTNEDSFKDGVINRKSFEIGNKRRLTTLDICFLSWLFEFIGMIVTVLSPTLVEHGAHNIYFVDAILMLIMLPAMYLINDEEIKTLITEQGYTRGILNMLVKSNRIQQQAPISGN